MSRHYRALPACAPLALALALAGPSCALAQSHDHPHDHDGDDARTLDRVLVTARAPSSALTWQTDPRLPRQPVPASDGADYLRTVPGFASIRNGGTNGDPVLRGMFGSRLGILSNDGVMVGACPSRMDNPLSYIAPETFDALTVIKGPQSVQWGPGNSAGTVRFSRDVPRFEQPGQRYSASALVGSNGRNDQVLDAAWGNALGYVRLGGNRSESGDYRASDGSRVASRWNKWNGDVAIGWTPDADRVLELSAGAGDAQARYAGRAMDGARFRRESFGLRYEHSNLPGAWDSVQANLYANSADHVMDNMPMAMASNPDRRTLGGRVAATWAWQRNQLVAGLDGQRSDHRTRSAGSRNAYRGQPRVADAQLRNLGAFVEFTAGAGQDARWISGLRIDRAQALDRRQTSAGGQMGQSRPNPTTGQRRRELLGSAFSRFEGQAGGHLGWYAGLGHASRMPDYWELFSPKMGPMGSANAFAAIRPERTTQLDVGLHYRGATVQAWVSAYAGRVQDYVRFSYLADGMTRADNVDVQIAGAEAGVDWQPAPQWQLSASLAHAWGRLEDGHGPLAQMPPLDGRLSVDWQGRRWSAGALLRAVAAQGRVNPGQGNVTGRDLGPSAGFATIGVNAGYRVGDTLQLTAGIDNLFDRAYSEHLNLAGSADFGYPAEPVRIAEPGRNLWFKVNYRY